MSRKYHIILIGKNGDSHEYRIKAESVDDAYTFVKDGNPELWPGLTVVIITTLGNA